MRRSPDMALRFEGQYRTRRLDNLGDPEWHNRRWQDIDLRMHARELDARKIDDAVDDIQAVALARLNDQLTPIINEAVTRLQSVGALFTGNSHSERAIVNGPINFVLSPETRASYVPTGWVSVIPVADHALGMTCRVLAYDRPTGLLELYSEIIVGTGTFDQWNIQVSGDTDLAHATRTDNPHNTTAAQTGAYTIAQADAAIDADVAAEATARDAAIA